MGPMQRDVLTALQEGGPATVKELCRRIGAMRIARGPTAGELLDVSQSSISAAISGMGPGARYGRQWVANRGWGAWEITSDGRAMLANVLKKDEPVGGMSFKFNDLRLEEMRENLSRHLNSLGSSGVWPLVDEVTDLRVELVCGLENFMTIYEGRLMPNMRESGRPYYGMTIPSGLIPSGLLAEVSRGASSVDRDEVHLRNLMRPLVGPATMWPQLEQLASEMLATNRSRDSMFHGRRCALTIRGHRIRTNMSFGSRHGSRPLDGSMKLVLESIEILGLRA
jgi:hypothetical protein